MEKVIHDDNANNDKEKDSKLKENKRSSGKSFTLTWKQLARFPIDRCDRGDCVAFGIIRVDENIDRLS